MTTAPWGGLAIAFLLLAPAGGAFGADTKPGYLWGEAYAIGGVLEGPGEDRPPMVCLQIGEPQQTYLQFPVPRNPDGTNADCTRPGSLLENSFPLEVSDSGHVLVIGNAEAEGIADLASVSGPRPNSSDPGDVSWLINTGALKAEAEIGFVYASPNDFGEVITSVNLFLPTEDCGKCASASVSLTLTASAYGTSSKAGGSSSATPADPMAARMARRSASLSASELAALPSSGRTSAVVSAEADPFPPTSGRAVRPGRGLRLRHPAPAKSPGA